MRRLAALFAVLAIAGCSSSTTSSASLGDTVYIDAGATVKDVPVGLTRHDFSDIAKALAAKDTQGAAEVLGRGGGRFVNRCTSGKLIDTALAGEREVRLPNGQAVWVDANWLKDSCS